MTEAEIRAEWKGPWKCERCGQFWDGDDLGNHGNTGGSHYSTMAGAYFAGYALCSGKVVPLDRRARPPERQELAEALRDVLDAFWDMSPHTSDDERNTALQWARSLLRRIPEEKP